MFIQFYSPEKARAVGNNRVIRVSFGISAKYYCAFVDTAERCGELYGRCTIIGRWLLVVGTGS